jgi:hypothetical protein
MLTLHELKLWILREVAAAASRPVDKFNLIGRAGMGGPFDWQFGRTIEPEERALAVRAFDELRVTDLIRPTYADLADPENWVIITQEGKRALEKGGLDDLDEALMSISAHLLQVRRGAWTAIASSQPDSFRQAAHSARELIDQVLKEAAPDDLVLADAEFKRHASEPEVTRKDRLKFLMRRFQGEVSESDVGIADKTIDLVLEINKKLVALAHSRSSPQRGDVEDCVRLAESALRRILTKRR